MNDKELDTLIDSHYQNQAQTLTSGAQANLLKLQELTGKLVGEGPRTLERHQTNVSSEISCSELQEVMDSWAKSSPN